MDDIGRDLGERFEHEEPLVHPRVGHFQFWLIDHTASEEQEIQIERPRPPPLLAVAIAPELSFNAQQLREQFPRRQLCFEARGGVDVRSLRHSAERRGLVKA